jgi:hypothetical protein
MGRDGWGAEARRIRQAIRDLGQRGRTERLPDVVRARVVAYVARRRAEGASWNSLGQAVGLSATTLQRWQAKAQDSKAARVLVPVSVEGNRAAVVATASSAVVLHSPTGWRVEGLEVGDAIVILRELG